VSATYLGKGKAEEIADLVKQHHATLIIVDHAISPIQERNLERITQTRVLDRSGLILDIFAQRATSSEGKLQVELAQLKHLSTRLVRGWTHLERQKGGIGLRGPGESQLETDRRLIGRRIKTLTQRLQKVGCQRALRRRSRQKTPIPTVSLVGYTNAGKSSLFRALTGENVLVEDKLFATLDPTMRRIEVPGYGDVVLSDTVGFVRELPHTLVAAFHSTLEEVINADCLILVNDYSDVEHEELNLHVHHVLKEIGVEDIPVIEVNNKIDLTGDEPKLSRSACGNKSHVWLSANKKYGLEYLIEALSVILSKSHEIVQLRLTVQAGRLRALLFNQCEVIDESIDEAGGVSMTVRADPAFMSWLGSQEKFKGMWSEAN